MGQAPKPRDMRSTFGKSLGIAVEGIMPEVYRNRSKADPANQSGSPWPDADDSDMDLISEQGYGTISGTGGSFSIPFTLPSLGLWLLMPQLSPGFGARVTVVAGDVGSLSVGVANALGGFDTEEHPLSIPYRASPTNVSLRTLAGSWRGTFLYDTGVPDEADEADWLSMSIDVTGSGSGTWSDVSGGGALIDVRMRGVRLGASPR